MAFQLVVVRISNSNVKEFLVNKWSPDVPFQDLLCGSLFFNMIATLWITYVKNKCTDAWTSTHTKAYVVVVCNRRYYCLSEAFHQMRYKTSLWKPNPQQICPAARSITLCVWFSVWRAWQSLEYLLTLYVPLQ